MATLKFSVGKGGVNHHGDVMNLQEFLNGVPPQSGGPIHKLPVHGIFTKATEQALTTGTGRSKGHEGCRHAAGSHT
jgi:hypothetical protein